MNPTFNLSEKSPSLPRITPMKYVVEKRKWKHAIGRLFHRERNQEKEDPSNQHFRGSPQKTNSYQSKTSSLNANYVRPNNEFLAVQEDLGGLSTTQSTSSCDYASTTEIHVRRSSACENTKNTNENLGSSSSCSSKMKKGSSPDPAATVGSREDDSVRLRNDDINGLPDWEHPSIRNNPAASINKDLMSGLSSCNLDDTVPSFADDSLKEREEETRKSDNKVSRSNAIIDDYETSKRFAESEQEKELVQMAMEQSRMDQATTSAKLEQEKKLFALAIERSLRDSCSNANNVDERSLNNGSRLDTSTKHRPQNLKLRLIQDQPRSAAVAPAQVQFSRPSRSSSEVSWRPKESDFSNHPPRISENSQRYRSCLTHEGLNNKFNREYFMADPSEILELPNQFHHQLQYSPHRYDYLDSGGHFGAGEVYTERTSEDDQFRFNDRSLYVLHENAANRQISDRCPDMAVSSHHGQDPEGITSDSRSRRSRSNVYQRTFNDGALRIPSQHARSHRFSNHCADMISSHRGQNPENGIYDARPRRNINNLRQSPCDETKRIKAKLQNLPSQLDDRRQNCNREGMAERSSSRHPCNSMYSRSRWSRSKPYQRSFNYGALRNPSQHVRSHRVSNHCADMITPSDRGQNPEMDVYDARPRQNINNFRQSLYDETKRIKAKLQNLPSQLDDRRQNCNRGGTAEHSSSRHLCKSLHERALHLPGQEVFNEKATVAQNDGFCGALRSPDLSNITHQSRGDSERREKEMIEEAMRRSLEETV